MRAPSRRLRAALLAFTYVAALSGLFGVSQPGAAAQTAGGPVGISERLAPPSVPAGESLTVSGVVYSATGAGVPGATVDVAVGSGAPAAVTTGTGGSYSVGLLAPLTTGTYPVTATVAGTSPAVSNQALLTVTAGVPIAIFESLSPSSVAAGGSVTVSGVVYYSSYAGASTQTVDVVIGGGAGASVTTAPDGRGYSFYSVVLTAPTAAGTYAVTATVAGTSPAVSSQALLTVTAGVPTAISVRLSPSSVPAGGSVTVSGVVYYSTSGGVSGASVDVVVGSGAPAAVVPVVNGRYSVALPAPATPGTYPVTVTVAGTSPPVSSQALLAVTAGVPVAIFETVSPSSVAAGGSVTVSGAVYYSSGAGVPTQTVDVVIGGGAGASVTTAPDGRGFSLYSVRLTVPAAVGTYPVTVTVAGTSPAVSSQAQLAVTAGAPATVAEHLSPSIVVAGGSLTVSGAVRDPFGNGVPDAAVGVSVGGGAPVSGTTGADGGYSVAVPAPTATGVTTVAVVVAGTTPVVSDQAPLTVTAGAPASIAERLSPSSVAAGGSVTVSGAVYDAYGNGVPDAFVDVAAGGGTPVPGTTGTDGSYSVAVTAPATAGVTQVTATVAGTSPAIANQVPLTVTAATPAAISESLSPSRVLPGGSLTVSGAVHNANGVGVANATVDVAVGGGTPVTATTGADGGYSVAVTAPTAAGATTVTVVVAGTRPAVSNQAPLTVAAGAPASIVERLSASSVAAGGSVTVSGAVYDAYGNGVPNRYVDVAAGGGTPVATATGPDGSYSVAVTAPAAAGATDVTATVQGSNPAVADQAPLTVTAGAPARIAIGLSPSVIPPGGSVTVSGTVYDANGNVVAGVPVDLAAGGGAPVGVVTGAYGNFSGNVTAPATAGAYPVTATVARTSVTQSATLTVKAAARAAPAITAVTRPTGGNVAAGTPGTETIMVSGGAGQPVPTGTVTFYLCGPSLTAAAPGCSTTTGVQVGSAVPLNNAGTATSSAYTATTSTGTYCWAAAYSGDGVFAPATDQPTSNSGAACFTVVPALSATPVAADLPQPSTVITGSRFGSLPGTGALLGCPSAPFTGDTPCLSIHDVTQGWTAGAPGDNCPLAVKAWNDNSIAVAIESGTLITCQPAVGDHLAITVTNPETGAVQTALTTADDTLALQLTPAPLCSTAPCSEMNYIMFDAGQLQSLESQVLGVLQEQGLTGPDTRIAVTQVDNQLINSTAVSELDFLLALPLALEEGAATYEVATEIGTVAAAELLPLELFSAHYSGPDALAPPAIATLIANNVWNRVTQAEAPLITMFTQQQCGGYTPQYILQGPLDSLMLTVSGLSQLPSSGMRIQPGYDYFVGNPVSVEQPSSITCTPVGPSGSAISSSSNTPPTAPITVGGGGYAGPIGSGGGTSITGGAGTTISGSGCGTVTLGGSASAQVCGTGTGAITVTPGPGGVVAILPSSGSSYGTTNLLVCNVGQVVIEWWNPSAGSSGAWQLVPNEQKTSNGCYTLTDPAPNSLAVFALITETSTHLTASPASPVFGQPVTLTATVGSLGAGAGSPTGSVTFRSGGKNLGSAPLKAGVATLTLSSLPPNTYPVTATYTGDTNFAGSADSSLTFAVSQASTTTTLTSAANPSVVGQAVTYTAAVAPVPPGAGRPGGSVTFTDGGATVCSAAAIAPSGKATCQVAYASPGRHSITASYSGDVSFIASTSATFNETVRRAVTAVTVTSLAQPFTLCMAGSPECRPSRRAPHSPPAPPGGCAGGWAGPPAAQASCTCPARPRGARRLPGPTDPGNTVARAVYDAVYVPSGPDVSVFCDPVTFTASVAVTAPGAGTPTGTVTFADAGAVLGVVPVATAGGVTAATLTVDALPAGVQPITATYSGDADFHASSVTLTQHVDYLFAGPLPPLAGRLAVNPYRSVPITFMLLDVRGRPVRGAGATLRVDGRAAVPQGAANRGDAFGQAGPVYVYILKLSEQGITSGTATLTIAVTDGTTHTFSLRAAGPPAPPARHSLFHRGFSGPGSPVGAGGHHP